MDKISIVVPCYNEEEMIALFLQTCEATITAMSNVVSEYWFIDDGSRDNTLEEIKKLNKRLPEKVHYISFSRNFGKEAALYAGLEAATGEYVVVMDVDLQDPPELMTKMFDIIKNNEIDCVSTRRSNRKGEPIIRSFFSNMFYRVINSISTTNIINGARDYRMMTRKMVSAVLELTEYNRFSKGIFSWVGFKTEYIEYENIERAAGTTSWSFWKLLRYSIDGITDFSEVPLSIASWVGMISFIGSMIGIAFIIIRAIIVPGSSVYGWASLICVFLLLGGIQLLCLGIVGKYIGKIYMQSKKRPIYLEKDRK
ncbi:glycosyltransferase family 2 protein [Paucilactobacillus nenjiangensis]|jgi:glycosyltransferase involved in cell wall biosynthesis|uniref:Glycosyltransferase family 2 protein n=1 Tax=Paucilactobacillus nenjiangensis TaxID=1296540 RepID=A0A5P1X382_9LACO|nr:glycosyltransferase family 2 protein [Paucilactobacillus nenjiangensis]QER67129.1 glycosyltransferase family 2 protein [Paucilactobacillus nenjiangensis]